MSLGRHDVDVDPDTFRAVMSRLAGPVTVVTTVDAEGRRRGFTASAVCSLSMTPPLLLVCVARSARCHDAFAGTERFAVNVLPAGASDHALRFARVEGDRFAGVECSTELGPPVLAGAIAAMVCERHEVLDGGDHSILIGRLVHAVTGPGEPLLYVNRAFGRPDRTDLAA